MQFIKINSIKKIQRTEQVYNFSVEKYENYIANNVVAHNCYVKEKESKFGSEEIDFELWVTILDNIFFADRNIRTSQVTLALDTLNQDPFSDSYFKMYKIAAVYSAMTRDIKQYKNNLNLSIHLTVNDVKDLEQYTKSEPFVGLDLISVSNINSLDDIKRIRERAPYAKINWNVLASTLNKKSEDQIRQIVQHVNQVYLLLPKAPLGKEGHDFNSLWKSMRKIPTLFPRDEKQETDGDSCVIPPLINKFILDGCIRDSNTFKVEGTGCSSNISRFQIWPDGRVTGCAYNSHEQYGKKANSIEDILDNLNDARTRYEFEKCTIPNYGLIKLQKEKIV